MAKVMLREDGGNVLFYVAKKDLEEAIKSIEFDSDDKWGGNIELSNGQVWFIEPGPKKIPAELNAKRVSSDDD